MEGLVSELVDSVWQVLLETVGPLCMWKSKYKSLAFWSRELEIFRD